jgi:aspartokinase
MPTGTTKPITFERERGVYDLRVTPDLAHVVVKVGSEPERASRIQRVFQLLSERSIPIFLIKLHRTAVTFAVAGNQLPEVETCLQDVAEGMLARRGLALVSIIASSMRDLTGVMVNIADSLQRAGARIYGVGDSHNSVQCLIEGSRAEKAVAELREMFGLGAGHE